jgi:hypothetical protein
LLLLTTLIVLLTAWAAHAAPAGADSLPPQIHTVAGGGSCSGALTSGGPCDGLAATSAPIYGARSVAALPGGGFLYVDAGNDLVREVSPTGIVTTVAGNGTTIDAPDGSLAVDSGLDDPVSVTALPDGGFLITEYDSSTVRMVSPGTPATATITTIAGTGVPGNNELSGPATPATSIPLDYPTDAEPTADGGVLIADTYNNEIRLLSGATRGATISTIAGGGGCNDVSSGCDGLAASAVELDLPDSVSPLQDGSRGYLVAEYGSDSIREVSAPSPSGTFTTVAGTPGDPGYAGDGGPATSAQLSDPDQVLSTSGGGFVIADTGNEVIRQVSASGTISTIAGNGIATYAGDGGAATSASLFTPASVAAATDGDGGLLVADQDNDRIREITLAPAVTFKLSPASPNGNDGWYVTPVTATIDTTESATINCELDPPEVPPAFGALPPDCPFTGGVTVTAPGAHTLYGAAENAIGDQSLPVSVPLDIDLGPPTITCSSPPSFPFGTAGAHVTATLSDSVSGPAAELLTAAADTSSLGQQAVQLTGANNAGINTFVNCSYTVTPLTLEPTPVTSSAFSAGSQYTTVKWLIVKHVAAPAVVTVMCAGSGCPFSAHRSVGTGPCRGKLCGTAPKQRSVVLTGLFADRQLASGTRLTVSVTEPDAIGRAALYTIRAGKSPLRQTACLAPGSLVRREKC